MHFTSKLGIMRRARVSNCTTCIRSQYHSEDHRLPITCPSQCLSEVLDPKTWHAGTLYVIRWIMIIMSSLSFFLCGQSHGDGLDPRRMFSLCLVPYEFVGLNQIWQPATSLLADVSGYCFANVYEDISNFMYHYQVQIVSSAQGGESCCLQRLFAVNMSSLVQIVD